MQAKKNAVEKALPGKSTAGHFQPAKPYADKTAQQFALSLTCKNPAPISPGITTEKTVRKSCSESFPIIERYANTTVKIIVTMLFTHKRLLSL